MPWHSGSTPSRLHPYVAVLLRLDHDSGCAACLLICSAFLHPERSPPCLAIRPIVRGQPCGAHLPICPTTLVMAIPQASSESAILLLDFLFSFPTSHIPPPGTRPKAQQWRRSSVLTLTSICSGDEFCELVRGPWHEHDFEGFQLAQINLIASPDTILQHH